MNRTVIKTMSLFVNGDDLDCPVRATFEIAGHATILDGEIEALIDGEWLSVADLEPSRDKRVRRYALDRIEEVLAEQAMGDERDAFCDLDPDEYADNEERSCA